MSQLPEALRKNSLLGYDTESSQRASDFKPRTFLHNDGGDFVITFSGQSKSHASLGPPDKVFELYQFNPDKKVFEFREVDLRKPAGEQISKVNPSRCVQCHFHGPANATSEEIAFGMRPNWDPYSNWNKFYNGHNDGTLPPYRVDQAYGRDVEDEFTAWKRFLAEERQIGIYHYLPNLETRFYNPKSEKPLFHFTTLTMELNRQRVRQWITTRPEWKEHQELLVDLINYHLRGGGVYDPIGHASPFLEKALSGLPQFEEAKRELAPKFAARKFSVDPGLHLSGFAPLWDDLALLDRSLGTHFSFGENTLAVFSTSIDLSKNTSAAAFRDGDAQEASRLFGPLSPQIKEYSTTWYADHWKAMTAPFRERVIKILRAPSPKKPCDEFKRFAGAYGTFVPR